MNDQNFLAANRAHWSEAAGSHWNSAFYDVDSFRAGKNTLMPIEVEEVGDVEGKSLLHLQCHFGLDTLSWARMGARTTGVDFAPAAIELARSLAQETNLTARFICSNIYDLPDVLDETFDIVFTSYGVLAWLPDLARWAKVVARFLKPGGTFHMVELHPLAAMLEYDMPGETMNWAYNYFLTPEAYRWESPHTYAAANAVADNEVRYEWSHSLSEVANSVIGAGLTLEYLNEFPFSCYRALECMTQGADGWWRLPERFRDLPMLFSIKATKS